MNPMRTSTASSVRPGSRSGFRAGRLMAGALLALGGTAALAAGPDSPPLRVEADMTTGELIGAARDSEGRMQGSLKKVAELLEGAKKKKDIIRVNCTGDKATG